MYKNLTSQAVLTFDLITESPLFIKSGEDNSLNPSASDHTYIKTYRNGTYEPFIPGTSLRGVFRCRAEKILNKKNECDIFNVGCVDTKLASEKKWNGKKRYQKSCPVCKLFGSKVIKSRISFNDSFVDGEYKVATRTSVGIERITGANKTKALFNNEYIDYGKFNGQINIENFEPWHIKLILCLIDEMNEGFITLGGLSSKGFGKIRIDNISLSLKYYGKDLLHKGYENKGFYSIKKVSGYEQINKILKHVGFENARKDGDIDEQAI